jgi:hypothetical protein
VIPVHTYVNSQVPHPWGRKFPLFLTYHNYNGAVKAVGGGLRLKLSVNLACLNSSKLPLKIRTLRNIVYVFL